MPKYEVILGMARWFHSDREFMHSFLSLAALICIPYVTCLLMFLIGGARESLRLQHPYVLTSEAFACTANGVQGNDGAAGLWLADMKRAREAETCLS